MSSKTFDQHGRYILEAYDRINPFTSFLPGIAGLDGIPLWVFYVNRGQAITSFGLGSKDQPIMEFLPANQAYRQTPLTGFRTFIKVLAEASPFLYEPFSEPGAAGNSRRMYIGMDEVEIEEISQPLGLKVNVRYFTLPHEDFAGLVREVRIENIANQHLSLEFLDGMPAIIPYGINNFHLKEMSRTHEAWMEVFNLENQIPFYRVRASVGDFAWVEEVKAGNFAMSFLQSAGTNRWLAPVVDPGVVFGPRLSLIQPAGFESASLADLYRRPQRTLGQTPCAFFGDSAELPAGQSLTIASLFGHVDRQEKLEEIRARFTPAFLEGKREESRQLVDHITAPIKASTARPIFDAYARQTYLDNLLRGGLPLTLPGGAVYHVYSRKHGDPERDYNYFYLAPEYYSQGNGNYRDVNQNRRSDVLFHPEVGDSNLRFFLSLVQLDGYNPLVINGLRFTLPPQAAEEVARQAAVDGLLEFFSEPFTPGALHHYLEDHPGEGGLAPEAVFEMVLSQSEHTIDAVHGEGFWVDHWTYNLDLLDTFLAIYPDRRSEMLFSQRDLPWFDSPASVQPRRARYQHTEHGLRQYHAVVKDEEKIEAIQSRPPGQTWLRTGDSPTALYRSTVFEKLFLLLVIKSATLDPAGMGVEMEADRPGWYDALNGLPGILGSSVSETYEIARLAAFLQSALEGEDLAKEVRFPEEFVDFFEALVEVLEDSQLDPLTVWRRTSALREDYRRTILDGISGREKGYTLRQIEASLKVISAYLARVLLRIETQSPDLPPTYFYYQAQVPAVDAGDLVEPPAVDPDRLQFTQHALPAFLEGSVHAMRIADPEKARRISQAVRDSGLYDPELGMYKVNASLAEVTHAIGRAKAFPPGWLENESVWLHMAYKYLLELLRSGQYEAFYRDVETGLVPFQPVSRYGRSPLENSSFIVSSAYPDPSLHGAGFVARLSGSTAEFLSIWFEMFAGRTPFFLEDGALTLQLKPRLPAWLFPQSGLVEYPFLGHTRVALHNPLRLDTWRTEITSVELIFRSGETVRLVGAVIPAPHASAVRAGEVRQIKMILGENPVG